MSSRIDDDGSKSICYAEFKKGIHDTGLDMDEQGYKVASLWFENLTEIFSSGAVLTFWQGRQWNRFYWWVSLLNTGERRTQSTDSINEMARDFVFMFELICKAINLSALEFSGNA